VRGLQSDGHESGVGEGYEFDVDYWKKYMSEYWAWVGIFIEFSRRSIIESVLRVMEPTDDPWKVRFTIVYSDGIADYIFDHEDKKVFVAPFRDIILILLKYGDVGIVGYPEKGSRVIVRRDKVIEDLENKVASLFRMLFTSMPEMYL
jgi:hypothetical protein